MIKIKQGFTEEAVFEALNRYYTNKPIIPTVPVVISSGDSIEMNVYMMGNIAQLSKMIHFALLTEKARDKNWYALLDLTVSGITVINFTNKEDIASPKLLDMPVVGEC